MKGEFEKDEKGSWLVNGELTGSDSFHSSMEIKVDKGIGTGT